ncbi:hypothetical protein [Janibacter sp. GS2]|uniref:hypothetical protein n=1 Tax=Janibacter sp. GS2 TaxID=3442646 RepID=UPI003EBD399A
MTEHTEAISPTRKFAPLAIILAIPLLFAAVFFYTSPVVLETGGDQGIFKCGSPSSPNTKAENVCQVPEKVERNKAMYSGLSGVTLLGLGAMWLLRGQRDDEDELDEDGRRARDIDLREDREERGRGPRGSLRGVDPDRGRSRGRATDGDPEVGTPDDVEVAPTRSSRRGAGGRRAVLRDDDFADPAPRRRTDDDWSSDGWR